MKPPKFLYGLVLLCAVLGAPHAQGETPECGVGQGSALTELGCELAKALKLTRSEGLVVVAPPESRPVLAREKALVTQVARVVGGALRLQAFHESASLAKARRLASKSERLVFLRLAIRDGQIRLSADVYPTRQRFWERLRNPSPSPHQHAFASRPVDAEIRGYYPAVPLVASKIQRFPSPERDVVALACADLDADQATELAIVARRRIHIGRFRSGRFQAWSSVAWAQLSPVAPFPLRQPIAGVWARTGFLDVGLSDRAQMVRFDAALQVIAKAPRRIPWPPGGCSRFAGIGLRGEIERCTDGDAPPPIHALGQPLDAIAGLRLVTRKGERRTIYAGRTANTNTVSLGDDAGRQVALEGAGAQLALGDLDGDGQPELLATKDTLSSSEDALVAYTWQDSGQLMRRFEVRAPGIAAMGVCPWEGHGLAPVVVATREELWVLQ